MAGLIVSSFIARPLVGINALRFTQCFHSAGGGDGKDIPKESFLEQLEEESQGGSAHQNHVNNRHSNVSGYPTFENLLPQF